MVGSDASLPRWRVQFMEQSIELLDFETIDQMVQIHGMFKPPSRPGQP